MMTELATGHVPCGNDDDIASGVRSKIRLCNAFKAVSSAYYDDMFRHSWKIPFFVLPTTFGLGGIVVIATLLYLATTQNKAGVHARERLDEALNGEIDFDAYRDVMKPSADGSGKWDISTLNMMSHLLRWTGSYLHGSLVLQHMIMPDGMMKNAVGWALRVNNPAP